MKTAIIGLPMTGKTSLFTILTQTPAALGVLVGIYPTDGPRLSARPAGTDDADVAYEP